MFILEEKNECYLPVPLLDEKVTCPLDTHLVIFQYAPHSRVSVMHKKLLWPRYATKQRPTWQRLFSDRPELHRMMEVKIVRLGQPFEPFFVQAVAKRSKEGRQFRNR